MRKFTPAERIAAALAVEAGDRPAEVGRRYGMSLDVVRRSVGLYREHGLAGFFRKNYRYTVKQKLEVLQAMHSLNLSHEETAIQFGIGGSLTVWRWERQYLENGIEGLTPKKNGRRPKKRKPKAPLTPYEQLLAENEYLRAENEYLKKLNALVAEREARDKPDKPIE